MTETTTDLAAKTIPSAVGQDWDTSSHEDFYKYYEKQSLTPATMARFKDATAMLLRIMGGPTGHGRLDIMDVGCGAGSQSKFWLERGHKYWGLDINEPLILLARRRAQIEGLDARFDVGTATQLPCADASVDICLLPELLEHVDDWQSCVSEAVRVLRPNGLLYINTSSRLCPVQQEFNLPLYSWYPAVLKRYFVKLSLTSEPALANFAKYPAVNWFSFYQLQQHLAPSGFICFDRFALIDASAKSGLAKLVINAVRSSSLLQYVGQVMTPYTLVVARKPG